MNVHTKKVIHCYKGSKQWINGTPGFGDFLRGTCHLHEILVDTGVELRIDMSQSGFAEQLLENQFISFMGDASDIAHAEEYFEDHNALRRRLQAFVHSDQSSLYISTNLGAWDRTTLPGSTIAFMQSFMQFKPDIDCSIQASLKVSDYEVVSLRCGDDFFRAGQAPAHAHLEDQAQRFLENMILPKIQHPLVLTSDSFEIKCALAERYGLLYLAHRSEHGAFNQNTLPVAMDLSLLSRSKYNYHINLWANWWSGFSHYTSMIFSIPSLNIRAPDFRNEEISAEGDLMIR